MVINKSNLRCQKSWEPTQNLWNICWKVQTSKEISSYEAENPWNGLIKSKKLVHEPDGRGDRCLCSISYPNVLLAAAPHLATAPSQLPSDVGINVPDFWRRVSWTLYVFPKWMQVCNKQKYFEFSAHIDWIPEPKQTVSNTETWSKCTNVKTTKMQQNFVIRSCEFLLWFSRQLNAKHMHSRCFMSTQKQLIRSVRTRDKHRFLLATLFVVILHAPPESPFSEVLHVQLNVVREKTFRNNQG